jgi:hypothetical protein
VVLAFKSEVDFGFDNFQQPKKLDPKETVAQVILNLFTMRPGSMPSMPHIGINIREYLYKFEEDIDLEELKKKIFTQCTEILSSVSIGDINVFIAPHNGQDILVIIIPLTGIPDDPALLLGFSKNTENELLFQYQFENGLSFN